MPGITNPAEEYFKDGLWGWVTDAWKKLVATAGGALHIQFAGQEADVEVTQTAAADLTPGICGWDGSAWRKLPMVWGFSGTYAEGESADDVAAGYATLTFSTVPAGVVRVVTTFAAVSFQANPNHARLLARIAGATHWLKSGLVTDACVTVDLQGSVVLKEGDYLQVVFSGCTAGDQVRAYASGYTMKIAE